MLLKDCQLSNPATDFHDKAMSLGPDSLNDQTHEIIFIYEGLKSVNNLVLMLIIYLMPHRLPNNLWHSQLIVPAYKNVVGSFVVD